LCGRVFATSYGFLLTLTIGAGFAENGSIVHDWILVDPLNRINMTNTSVGLTLVALVGFAAGLVRLAKDTVGVSLSDFLDGLWHPRNYLYRPHCLLLLLSMNTFILVLLLILFFASIMVAGYYGGDEPIQGLGKNIVGSGLTIVMISLLALVLTYLTPGSVRRLQIERKLQKRRKPSSKKSRSALRLTCRVLSLFIESGRLGVSWIAGLAAAITLYTSGDGPYFRPLLVFLVMTGLTAFGFVANDICDRTKDRCAGKDRPIARGELRPELAAGLCAVLLSCVFLLSAFVKFDVIIVSMFIATALIFYSPFSSRVPLLKGGYTATLCTLPFFLAYSAADIAPNFGMIVVVFLFITFRELLLDSVDAKDDGQFGLKTLAVVIGPKRSECIGWGGMLFILLIGQFLVEGWVPLTLLILSILSLVFSRAQFSRDANAGLRATRATMLLGVLAAAT
jgi:4-hydroxybenzoate polyprenyltransferase